MNKSIIYTITMILILFVHTLLADERQIVKVGGYHFPPFVVESHEKASGISLDFIDVLNSIQTTYQFQFVLTSSKRRFDHFNHGRYDMILFESIDWGWKDKKVDASTIFLSGGSKYVTRAATGKDQHYFDSLKGKSILIIRGYHYGFCNYNTDEQYLKKYYNATMTSTHDGNIFSVVKGRADITVVIKAFFQKFLHENPHFKDKLLVSEKYDLRNYYTILVRKKIKPDINEINTWLLHMESEGIFKKFWSKYGIQ